MAKRPIRTVAGIERASRANQRRAARYCERPYVLQAALARNLARFDALERIADPSARFEAFRQIPALEFDLDAVWSGFSEAERKSLAQQDRARHPRAHLTRDGSGLETLIGDLLKHEGDPWKLKAKQYWPQLLDRLRAMGLNPSQAPDPKYPDRERIEYRHAAGRRHLTIGQFLNLVSKVRRGIPKLP